MLGRLHLLRDDHHEVRRRVGGQGEHALGFLVLTGRPQLLGVVAEQVVDVEQALGVEVAQLDFGAAADTPDVRLDDPSVSRSPALIVCEDPEAMRVLDDRSLNGIYLNGELVEWGRLKDGDELTIGRFRLFALEA